MNIRVPTPDGSYIPLTVDVINIDVTFFIGLDALDSEKLFADNVDKMLISRRYGCSIPITRRLKNMYITWHVVTTAYTRSELKNMHQKFWHPSASKLYSFLKRMKPEDTNENIIKVLKKM